MLPDPCHVTSCEFKSVDECPPVPDGCVADASLPLQVVGFGNWPISEGVGAEFCHRGCCDSFSSANLISTLAVVVQACVTHTAR